MVWPMYVYWQRIWRRRNVSYCSGLGFRKTFDFIRNDRIIGFYLEVSQRGYLEIFQRDGIDIEARSPIQHFCLEVDDIEQVRRRLAENGYEATEKKLGADQSWQIWTTDPSGVKIEFHQYTDRSSQVTRENCVLE